MAKASPTMAPASRASILTDWWASLEATPGDRSKLRRCPELVDVMMAPAYHRLRRPATSTGMERRLPLALVAGVLAHVRESADAHPAVQMAQRGRSGRSVVADTRFQRLLRSTEPDELFRPMVRAIGLLGGAANVTTLGLDLYNWNEDVRLRWAEKYYENAEES